MNYLFIHQNFPGQFKFLAPALAAKGHRVVALASGSRGRQLPPVWRGVQTVAYVPTRGSTSGVHPWVSDLEAKAIRAEACLKAALTLREQGFNPDVVIAHPGWGESMFIKQVWPQARLGIYCEFYYLTEGGDSGFDPEFAQMAVEDRCRVQMKNLNNLIHFETADAGLSPTAWQASVFPQPFRQKITVAHDGVDTDAVKPNPDVVMRINGEIQLTRDDEVITFVNRNLEPYRGFHIFMRALPDLLQERPKARVMIVGGSDVSYGAKPPGGGSWRAVLTHEIRHKISDADWKRVHFLGKIPYPTYLQLLQLSSVHVYWTYPFVLSWSLLEAMSSACAVVASDTAPVREAVQHGVNGRLVDFFKVDQLVSETCRLLDNPAERLALGMAARNSAIDRYDLKRICLPTQLAWADQLAKA